MKFWIVTPSYNQPDWLKLCIASVADQAGSLCEQRTEDRGQRSDALTSDLRSLTSGSGSSIHVHHHVQDACSTDGTREYLAEHLANSQQLKANGYTFSYESSPDEGMYDAINKGWKLAPDDVDVIAHLNCDEQYLLGALKVVAEFFKAHQKADVVLADMIVVDKGGEYICHRRSLKPYKFLSRFCCAGMTATTFQRASVTKEKGVFFDTSWRNIGDKVWYNELHKVGCRFAVCNQMVSIFTDTGENLNWTEEGRREKIRYEEEFLHGSPAMTRVVARLNGLRRMLKERSAPAPSQFSLYKMRSKREIMQISDPRWRWNKSWRANGQEAT